jgi:hypothetical protein
MIRSRIAVARSVAARDIGLPAFLLDHDQRPIRDAPSRLCQKRRSDDRLEGPTGRVSPSGWPERTHAAAGEQVGGQHASLRPSFAASPNTLDDMPVAGPLRTQVLAALVGFLKGVHPGLSRPPPRPQLRSDRPPLGSVPMPPQDGRHGPAQVLAAESYPSDGRSRPGAPPGHWGPVSIAPPLAREPNASATNEVKRQQIQVHPGELPRQPLGVLPWEI